VQRGVRERAKVALRDAPSGHPVAYYPRTVAAGSAATRYLSVLAARWAQKIAAREARVVADRNSAAADEPASLPSVEPAKPISLRDELRKMGLL
jgi:putative intracellular protease/amidase